MFIVEGADYVGKSSFLKRVRDLAYKRRMDQRYGPTVLAMQHWGRLPDGFDYYESYLRAIREDGELCDRFTLSELAYGQVYRGGPNQKFTPHIRRLIARELNRWGSVQCLVWADWDSVSRRMKLREDEMLKNKEHYHALIRAFGDAMRDLALGRSGMTYVFEVNSSDHCTEASLNMQANMALDVWKMHLDRSIEVRQLAPESWGYLWPRIVLIGEQVGGDITSTRPFASRNGCSKTLSRMLDAAEVPERFLYLVNAYDKFGKPLNDRLFALFAPKVIVAMGKEALRYCNERSIPCIEFPHPQWIHRFHHKEIERWGQNLRKIVSPALNF